MKERSPCRMSVDRHALEEQHQQSLDLDATLDCSNSAAADDLRLVKPEPTVLEHLQACLEGVDPKWADQLASDMDNTQPGELAELLTACGVGAATTAETGPGALIGCAVGVLGNELAELVGTTTGAIGDVTSCLVGE